MGRQAPLQIKNPRFLVTLASLRPRSVLDCTSQHEVRERNTWRSSFSIESLWLSLAQEGAEPMRVKMVGRSDGSFGTT